MSKEILNISIPVSINSSHTQKEIESICAEAIKDSHDEFLPLFERLIDKGDSNLTVMDDCLRIVHIEINNNSGFVQISFDTDYFSPCKDGRFQGEEEATEDFDIINDKIVFEIELPPAWRPDQHDM